MQLVFACDLPKWDRRSCGHEKQLSSRPATRTKTGRVCHVLTYACTRTRPSRDLTRFYTRSILRVDSQLDGGV
jgi:hypothetical protein